MDVADCRIDQCPMANEERAGPAVVRVHRGAQMSQLRLPVDGVAENFRQDAVARARAILEELAAQFCPDSDEQDFASRSHCSFRLVCEPVCRDAGQDVAVVEEQEPMVAGSA